MQTCGSVSRWGEAVVCTLAPEPGCVPSVTNNWAASGTWSSTLVLFTRERSRTSVTSVTKGSVSVFTYGDICFLIAVEWLNEIFSGNRILSNISTNNMNDIFIEIYSTINILLGVLSNLKLIKTFNHHHVLHQIMLRFVDFNGISMIFSKKQFFLLFYSNHKRIGK